MEQTENKYITVAYKMYMLEDGEKEFGEEATADNPFPFITGMGLTLEAFENAVKDLEEGDEFDFTIPCAEAYGEYDEEHVIELPKGIFLVDGKFDDEHIVPDAIVPLMTAEGQRVNGSVVEVKDDVVVMDMNHPLAGCDLQFTGMWCAAARLRPRRWRILPVRWPAAGAAVAATVVAVAAAADVTTARAAATVAAESSADEGVNEEG